MFDDGTGELVSKMIADGLITDASSVRGNQVGAAGQLIGQLEAFPDAEMDIVLDVRERLTRPLIRFRAALAQASTEIESRPGRQTRSLVKLRTFTVGVSLPRSLNSKWPCRNSAYSRRYDALPLTARR